MAQTFNAGSDPASLCTHRHLTRHAARECARTSGFAAVFTFDGGRMVARETINVPDATIRTIKDLPFEDQERAVALLRRRGVLRERAPLPRTLTCGCPPANAVVDDNGVEVCAACTGGEGLTAVPAT